MKTNQLKIKTLQIICFFLLSFLSTACDNYGKKLMFKKGEVYYKDGASEEEAKKLGDYLLQAGFFDDITTKSVQLTKKEGAYYFRMVIKEGFNIDEAFIKNIKVVDEELSKAVFDGKSVITDLCDNQFKTIKEISKD